MLSVLSAAASATAADRTMYAERVPQPLLTGEAAPVLAQEIIEVGMEDLGLEGLETPLVELEQADAFLAKMHEIMEVLMLAQFASLPRGLNDVTLFETLMQPADDTYVYGQGTSRARGAINVEAVMRAGLDPYIYPLTDGDDGGDIPAPSGTWYDPKDSSQPPPIDPPDMVGGGNTTGGGMDE